MHKAPNVFSEMAIDQWHEQNNAIIKGTGGAVGLTENPSALQRWMVAGPELARLLPEFEQSVKPDFSENEYFCSYTFYLFVLIISLHYVSQ